MTRILASLIAGLFATAAFAQAPAASAAAPAVSAPATVKTEAKADVKVEKTKTVKAHKKAEEHKAPVTAEAGTVASKTAATTK